VSSAWDPQLYLRFGEERTRPARDLVAAIPLMAPERIIDLGCGPGNSTAILRARWPKAQVTGLDSDEAMLAAARASDSEVTWTLGDAVAWGDGEAWDLVFSNALLQRLPDHDRLLPRLLAAVRPGGCLAIQMPFHLASPIHRHMLELAALPEWRARMARAQAALVIQLPSYYYDVLAPLAASVTLWKTEYQHVMSDAAAIVTWMRGTGLRPFLSALGDDEQRGRFEAQLLERVVGSYPVRRDGRVLFPFERLFMIACPGGSPRP